MACHEAEHLIAVPFRAVGYKFLQFRRYLRFVPAYKPLDAPGTDRPDIKQNIFNTCRTEYVAEL